MVRYSPENVLAVKIIFKKGWIETTPTKLRPKNKMTYFTEPRDSFSRTV